MRVVFGGGVQTRLPVFENKANIIYLYMNSHNKIKELLEIRALKLSNIESFRALKLSNLESFRALQISKFESFRALKLSNLAVRF